MKHKIFVLILALMSASTSAAEVPISAIPTKWHLQNYISNNVVVWFSGSSCNSGQLTFNASADINDKNRFWSMVMAAKIASKKITVYYDNSASPNQCIITSFILDRE